MILRSLCQLFEQIAPLNLSAEWDNNGLLVGDASADVRRMLLTIDLTDAVLAEAVQMQADLVVCYHPPIFKPLLRVVADTAPSSRIYSAIRQGVALYAMHTTLDAAAGGTNDVLAEALGLVQTRPLAPHSTLRADGSGGVARRVKLVTFVPEEAVEKVADAIFAAGGGQIGNYARCSFRVNGTGTFLGEPNSHPAVGHAGNYEHVPEVRMEIEVPADRSADAVAALRKAHPYETPAFDLCTLAEIDERVGIGRIGQLAEPATLDAVVARIKRALNVEAVWLASGPVAGGDEPIRVAACCAGSCGQMYRRAISGGAQLYLTGEFRHHDALEAAQAGMAVAAVRHSVSERRVLHRLADRLGQLGGELTVRVSQSDADPFRWA